MSGARNDLELLQGAEFTGAILVEEDKKITDFVLKMILCRRSIK